MKKTAKKEKSCRKIPQKRKEPITKVKGIKKKWVRNKL